MTPIERGERAKHLLADRVMVEVFADLRAELVARLEALPIGDIDSQHEVALMLQLLKQVRSKLEKYGQEVEIDQHRKRNDSFVERIRERFTP